MSLSQTNKTDENTGAHILAAALRSLRPGYLGVVPGRPITQAGRLLVETGDARWITHEAVALQMALGAAADGSLAVAMMKQVGLNAAMDVASSAAVHRSGGAVLLIVGDDPGAFGSDVEGDARVFAGALELPSIEPAGVDDIPHALRKAATLSAENRIPVIFRVTTQMMAATGAPASDALKAAPFGKAAAVAPLEVWTTDPQGQRIRLHRTLKEIAKQPACEVRDGQKNLRIVASGHPAGLARPLQQETLFVRRAQPLPDAEIAAFVTRSQAPILVLEDGQPLLERVVIAHATGPVLGRLSGHVPSYGPVDVGLIAAAALKGEVAKFPDRTVEAFSADDIRGLGTLYTDLKELELLPVVCDAGLCGVAPYLMPEIAPLSYGLGSAIGTAAGVAVRRGKAVAVIGDMGFFHAGIVGLLQVVREQAPVLIVVHDNGVAAYTGGQPHVGSAARQGERQIDIAAVASGVGIQQIQRVTSAQARKGEMKKLIAAWKANPIPAVIVLDDRAKAEHEAR